MSHRSPSRSLSSRSAPRRRAPDGGVDLARRRTAGWLAGASAWTGVAGPAAWSAATAGMAGLLLPGGAAQAAASEPGGLVAFDGPAPPVYRTRVPPPFELQYDLQYAQIRGKGLLRFTRPTPAAYRFELQGTVFGMVVLEMISQGRVGDGGLIPERYSDRRKGKDALVATLDWRAAQVRYSSRPQVIGFPPGTQDRLSWLAQLPAILLADETRRRPGARMPMFVTGARADAGLWTLVVHERVDADPASGGASVLHVARAPREPGDSRVEAWIDATRGFLPVRARMSSGDGAGPALDLTLAA